MENNQVAPTTQNQVQAQTVLPHLKSGDEKYELAIQGNKIIVAPIEELKEVLRLVMLKLGIRGHNLPDAEEKADFDYSHNRELWTPYGRRS